MGQHLDIFKNYIIFASLICFSLFFLPLHAYSAIISIPSIITTSEECSLLNVELTNTEDKEIYTTVITFTFDPGKIQIGCNTAFNVGIDNEPIIYEQDYTPPLEKCEQPITISKQLLDIGIKYRVAIYPQGVFVVALWGGTQKIQSGTLFTVPFKVLSGTAPGEVLPILLPTKEQPVFIERTFPDNHKEGQSFYCSLSDINALPEEVNVVSGNIAVKNLNEGTVEGIQEGAGGEGEGEQVQEGDNTEGEKTFCGCQKSTGSIQKKGSIFSYLLNIDMGMIFSLVVLLRQL